MTEPSIPLIWQAFQQPKHGNTPQEYEDACAGDAERGRFAVADGASESAFAGAWARILVKAFVQVPGSWSAWLPAARKRWRTKVEGQDLPWYTETKFQEGAQAALLGVAFGHGRWQARAVGDCCLFHVRGEVLLQAFPLSRACDFNNQPALLCSRPRGTTQLKSTRRQLKGDWQAQDGLYLMSDALAKWFLSNVEKGQKPWRELQNLESNRHFARWVEKLRQGGEMRNDDVTLVRIESQKC